MDKTIHIRALKIAVVVGTLLATINYADKLLASSMLNSDWIKLVLSYFVPYGVSWYSAASAKKTSG